MATSEQVAELIDSGHSYETAARRLGISPGLAFMVVTGLPADGGGVSVPEEREHRRVLPGSAQHLVNPPTFNPTRNATVIAWVKRRAAREQAARS